MAPRYRLKLERLDFISAVDNPAQETAKVLLIKRAGGVSGFARVAKVDDELGLVFCWAFTSTTGDGADYHDLQGDCIDQDFVKACADFMTDGGGAVDEMHDSKQTGRVVFAMPMTPQVAEAFGVTSKTVGLMIALKPSADALAKFKSGEYTGVSIAGTGTRETVKRLDAIKMAPTGKCADCGSSMSVDVEKCADCGGSMAYKRAPDADEVPLYVVEESPLLATASRKSTPHNAVSTLRPQPEGTMADPIVKTETVTKFVAIVLTAAQGEHYAKLSPAAQDAFLAKSDAEREAVVAPLEVARVAKAAADNEVVYKSTDGTIYRKRDDERMVAMAKRTDTAEANAATAVIEKRASEDLSHFAKSMPTRAAIVRAIDGIADEAVRKEALESLRAANVAMKELGIPRGFTPSGDANSASPAAALRAHIVKFQSDRKIASYEVALMEATAPGPTGDQTARDLMAAAQEARMSGAA